jgi:hypothetical protein
MDIIAGNSAPMAVAFSEDQIAAHSFAAEVFAPQAVA